MITPDQAIVLAEERKLPQGWRRVKLGELCQFIRGVSFDKAEVRVLPNPGYLPILRAGNIGKALDVAGDLVWVPDHYVSGEQRLRAGDIAICMSSGSPGVVGKTAQLKQAWEGSVGAFCGIIRARETNLAEYLGLWFRSPEFAAWRDGQTRGANIQNLRFSQFENFEIALPPLNEQKRIAAILNEQMAAVERVRAAAEAQLEAAKTLPAAYLRAVFNTPEAQRWPRRPFGELVENFDGKRVPVKLDERRGKRGPYPYYGASGIIDYVDEYLFEGEYLLVSEDGANLLLRSSPIAFKASGKFWVNNHAHVVQPRDTVSLEYLLYFLAVTDLKPYVTGAAQPKLTQEDMNSIPVPVAPMLEQQRIMARLSEQMAVAERTRKTLEEQLDTINKLPAALLRRAFSGEL